MFRGFRVLRFVGLRVWGLKGLGCRGFRVLRVLGLVGLEGVGV